MSGVPGVRVRPGNDGQVKHDGAYVLYWMIAFRRREWNSALERAVEWSRELDKPVLVLEALRVGYPWASDRLHRFLFDGFLDNRDAFSDAPVRYYPYVEREPGEGSGLLARLAEDACVVVTDDYPAFFLPRMIAAAGRKLEVLLEAVDGNGLLPMRVADKAFTTAHSFRRFLQKNLPHHLDAGPARDPFSRRSLPDPPSVPREVSERWPEATKGFLRAEGSLAELPIDHDVEPAALAGGTAAARRALARFLGERLSDYAEHANDPDRKATSELSPYLHFGHLSSHEVFHELTKREGWSADGLARRKTDGRRGGWWKMSESAEAFLDQLVTWRELGFNGCVFLEDHDRYETLPEWARETIEEHGQDERAHRYGRKIFEAARSHDEVWNAAQRQLLRTGVIHNYLRMLWGKKIFEWSASPRKALSTMIALNDKYALDGRDPNSYSGIFWCLGRYDRAWGPEREVYGKIRYMSSENTVRKLEIAEYLEAFGE